MAILLKPDRWKRNPTQPLAVNWDHPLSQGLLELGYIAAGRPYSAIQREQPSPVGLAEPMPTAHGGALRFTSNSTYINLARNVAAGSLVASVLVRTTKISTAETMFFTSAMALDGTKYKGHWLKSFTTQLEFGFGANTGNYSAHLRVGRSPTGTLIVGESVSLGGVCRGNTNFSLYKNGKALSVTTAGSGGAYVGGVHNGTVNYMAPYTVGGAQDSASWAFWGTELTADAFLELEDNPFAMLVKPRRRVWVEVAAGGASATTPTAWRIRAAQQAGSGWRIRAAAPAATAWRVRGAVVAVTAWRIKAAAAASAAWRVLGSLPRAVGWRIRTAAAAPTAWRIRAAAAAATAWRVFGAALAPTAWRIRASAAAATAWRVLTSATRATAWRVQAAAAAATSWRVQVANALATAWRTQAASAAAMAWRVQTSVARSTAWQVLAAGLSATVATAWRIQVAVTRPSSWRVLAATANSTGWRVLTASARQSAWRVLGTAASPATWRVLGETGRAVAWRVLHRAEVSTGWRVGEALALLPEQTVSATAHPRTVAAAPRQRLAHARSA